MQEAKDKECYEDFDKALQLDEDNANIYHHRGQVCDIAVLPCCFLTTGLLIQFP